MRNKLSKSNLIIAQKGISLIAVFTMLVVSFVAIIPLSLGWFAKNNQVTASGMHNQAYKTDFDVSYKVKDGGTWQDSNVTEIFSQIRAPGDSTEIKITIKHKSYNKYAVNFTGFGMEAPTAIQDIPKIDSEGNIRYLSTEINTQLLAVSVAPKEGSETSYTIIDDSTDDDSTDEIASAPVYLRGTTSGEKMGTETASKNPGAAERIDYIDAVSFDNDEEKKIYVPAGGSVTFTIRVSFVNTGYDQNVYKDFVNTKGKCERSFFYTYEDIMPVN
jgi:hypothetical protein